MQSKEIIAGAVLAVLLGLATSNAAAEGAVSSSVFAAVSGQTSIPIGHAEFCKSHRGECSPNAQVVETVELTEALWHQLLAVNASMNTTIVPITDEDLYQVAEFWTYPNGYGDCEDIALAKRRELIASGWAPSTLLMAVVRESNGNGHAVLMVRTDRGDLILDNQDGMIRLWTETSYHFVKRQSQSHAGQWVDILDDRAIVVAAAG